MLKPWGFASGLILILATVGFAGVATVSWDPNSESDLAGYKIYYGLESRIYSNQIYVGNVISYRITGLEEGQKYFFAATALDFSGNESQFSIEVSATITDSTASDNRAPSRWEFTFHQGDFLDEEIVLEIIPYGDETQDETGWTIWGHVDRDPVDAGLFISNLEGLLIRVVFDARIIGYGSCLDASRMLVVEPSVIGDSEIMWLIDTTFQEVEFITNAQRPFINFVGDCWVPNSSDANLRIENIEVFK